MMVLWLVQGLMNIEKNKGKKSGDSIRFRLFLLGFLLNLLEDSSSQTRYSELCLCQLPLFFFLVLDAVHNLCPFNSLIHQGTSGTLFTISTPVLQKAIKYFQANLSLDFMPLNLLSKLLTFLSFFCLIFSSLPRSNCLSSSHLWLKEKEIPGGTKSSQG